MKPEKEQEFKEILARIKAKDENLKEVKLNDFGLNVADAILLAQSLPQSQVVSLDLGYNTIGNEGEHLKLSGHIIDS